jgi:adenine-specific DNA-methyltransferase
MMNYIGSKLSLLDFVEKAVNKCKVNKKEVIFCDIFSGTGIVARKFKENGYKVIANDIEDFSYSLINHYIKNSNEVQIKEQIQQLNKLSGIKTGFIYNNYCPSGAKSKVTKTVKNGTEFLNRKYFSDQNGMIIDEARSLIDYWYKSNEVDSQQYNYLLAVIIEAADKIANTTSVYGAFLKDIKASASRKIKFKELEYTVTELDHEVYKKDVNDLIPEIAGDILYLDPPYNNRQYGANYHVLNTIAKNDNPEIKGVTGMREYTSSNWCKKGKVEKEFEELIKNAKFEYVLLSYNNEGLMSLKQIEKIMKKYGEYSLIKQGYQRYKSDNDSDQRKYKAKSVVEYIHILKKKNNIQ